jgi:hypothetical protein
MTIDVNTVATDADLEQEIGGPEQLANILPREWTDAEQARQRALALTLKALRRRTPPIVEGSLSDVTELEDAVVYGALEHLYRMAMASGSANYAELRKLYHGKFEDEVSGLTPTLNGENRGTANSISLERR